MNPIQAAKVERDEGYWTHPDLPEWDEGTPRAECVAWAAANGGEFVVIWFESDADEDLIERYFDDGDIDRFTNAMRVKMAYARAKGRSGWDDPAQCSGEQLATMLVEHLTKGNDGTFEDVANFAMMLHQRQESPSLLVDAVNAIKASVVNELVAVLNEASENAFDNDYLQEARAMDDAAEIISARAKQIMKIKDVEAS